MNHGQRIHTALQKGLVQFSFTKADGTERRMLGTLNMDLIPEDKRPKNSDKGLTEQTEFHIIKVYDVENDGWRSFKPSTLIEYNDDVNGAVVIVQN